MKPFELDIMFMLASRRGAALRFLVAFLLAQFFLPCPALALDPGKDLLQYNCQTWSRQNGLPMDGITAITQTQDGYLWMGTASGLVRFDGVGFKAVDLSHFAGLRTRMVTCLANAKSAGIWVGLNSGGFGFFDGQSFAFRGNELGGRPDLSVRSIIESQDGTLSFAAESGAYQLTASGSFENLLNGGGGASDTLDTLCGYADQKGRLWFGTANQGVFLRQVGKVTHLFADDLGSTTVWCIAEDGQGQIWIGTSDGLFCYDVGFHRIKIPPLADEVRALLVDREGALWIGTSGRGLWRYQNGAYESIQKIDGLADDYVNALAEDREGSLWVGTRGGVSQISDVKFPVVPAAGDPAVKDALGVCASRQGGLWIGSSGGVTYFNGREKTYSTETGLPNNYVKRVFEAANGDLYLVCHGSTLSILSAGRAVAVYTNSSMFVGAAEDARGVVVSAGGNLYRAGTNYFEPYAFKKGVNPQMNWILNLASGRDGVLWVATVNGIFRVQDDEFRQWSTAQGLVDSRVNWICEDSDGVVWGATLAGIVRLKDSRICLINRKHGLFDDNIYSVIPDNLGHLWVDSAAGIFCVSRQGMNDFAEGRTNHVDCTAYDGLDSVKTTAKTVQERVAARTTDGRIWFPYPNGVVVVDPALIPTNRIAPPVNIDQINVDGKTVPRSECINVPPGRGELEFHFNALSFVAVQKLRFRYCLEGYDHGWVDAGDRRMVLYANLKPGSYTFHVIAANADGIWNETGDQARLELRPHFFQTNWFYLLCGFGTVALLASAYLWRIRQLQQKQMALERNRDLLEEQVRNRTAELAQANQSLRQESEEHKLTAFELRQRTQSLEKEIEERKQMQLEVERVHRQLLDVSRHAGMAEIATNVLHNVGNVLNSVNVSSTLISDRVRQSKVSNLGRVAALFQKPERDLAEFLINDPKGRQLPAYLANLGAHLTREQQGILKEMQSLTNNIGHIKEIVAMQQSYAKASGVLEPLKLTDLVEDAINMNNGAILRHQIKIVREFQASPTVVTDKHKVLQILVNLIRNAKYACDDSRRDDKQITLRVTNGDSRACISVIDNGLGIPPENLTRIFNHGFTTKKDGHGFGLHGGANAAREMGGTLTVLSEGTGCGAAFTLELPADQPKTKPA